MTPQPDFRALCAELEKECFSLYAEMSATQDFDESYEERMYDLMDRARAALSTQPLAPVPVSERLPELRPEIERVLNDARCGPRLVGNIELADRLIDAVLRWAIPLPEEKA